jgi:hypothetical protein
MSGYKLEELWSVKERETERERERERKPGNNLRGMASLPERG